MIKKLYNCIIKTTCLLCIFFAYFDINTAHGFEKAQIKEINGEIYINKISVAELEKYFLSLGYDDYVYMPESKYPPIFLKTMPYDFDKIAKENRRNSLFLMTMIPLALKINENILLERFEVITIEESFITEKKLDEKQKEKLEQFAVKYDIFTRLQGLRRYSLIIDHLKEKINPIPPSILIATAAIETNWGTSKSLKLGNSLYKELVWYSDEGLEVEEDKEDKSYKIRIFNSLYDSMESFAHNINSSVNYELFRHSRLDIIRRNKAPNGRDMAHNFLFKSSLDNFIGLLNYTITFYELTNIDTAKLGYTTEEKLDIYFIKDYE